MQSSETKFTVGMTCEGCANAVRRIVGKIEGAEVVSLDIPGQEVVIKSTDATVVYAALKKWADASGKKLEMQA